MRFGITFVIGDIEPSYSDGKLIYGTKQRHTWDDWKLIPSKRPVVPYPEVKEQIVDVDSIDGSGIDLTESLAGHPLFKDREFEIEFYRQQVDNWSGGIKEIANWLHGNRVKMILDDDPAYYYEGRFTVSDTASDKYYSKLTFKGKLYPWKLHIFKSDDEISDLIWDNLDFDGDYEEAGVHEWYRLSTGERYLDTIPIPATPNAKTVYLKVYSDHYNAMRYRGSNGSFVKVKSVRCRYKVGGVYRKVDLPVIPSDAPYALSQLRIPPNTRAVLICDQTSDFEKYNYIFRIKFQIVYRRGEF